MRVMRGKTFEGPTGIWEKVEVELDGNDLLPDERGAADAVKLQLLEIRADKHLVLFLSREGKMSADIAREKMNELDEYKKKLMSLRPKTPLRTRGTLNEE